MGHWTGTCVAVLTLLMLGACPRNMGNGGGGNPVAPTITTQPANQMVNAGQKAMFTVAATGTPAPTYQWQNAATNQPIAGATSATYTISQTTLAQNGSTFNVVVSNGVNPAATSNTVTLTVNGVAPSITTQPTNQSVTEGLSATFTVVATGAPTPTYQWQDAGTQTNIAGATSASYTISQTTLAENGSTYRVIVSNGVNPQAISNTVTLTVNSAPPPSNTTVLTYHNDNSRTGQNLNETILTTANVNQTMFGKLGSMPVDGLVDAEPLYVGGLTINGATHNVVFVATENDSVYAFDADTFTQLWHNPLLNGTGESPSDDHGCGQVEPTIGITSTPVIDLNAGPNGTIFVVAMSKNGGTYFQRLHALDITTGNDLMAATTVAATAPGNGTGSSGGTQTFDPASYEERAALLLSNGVIYTTWTSHCDAAPYNSWVIAYGESSLQRAAVLDLTANGATQGGQEGGIWMAGDGPAADSGGFIYFLVGNGTFDTSLAGGFPNKQDYGNCFMKLSTSGNNLSVADYFAMDNGQGNAETESSGDTDLGSGGEMLLPDLKDAQGNTHHLAVGAGKDSNLYVVNRDNMGKFSSNDGAIYQELGGALSGGVWSAPAYFNGTVYYGPVSNNLLAFTITNAKLGASPSSVSAHSYGYPGAAPSVSANGTTNGIVWTLEAGGTGVLRAYDATNLGNELYDSNQAGTRDQFPSDSNDKFVTPMIANGKVYVGTPSAVVVFGLLNQGAGLVRKPRARRDPRRSLPPMKPPHPGSSTPGF